MLPCGKWIAGRQEGKGKSREETTMVVPARCDGGLAQVTEGHSGNISVQLTGLVNGLDVGVKERKGSGQIAGLGRPDLFISL